MKLFITNITAILLMVFISSCTEEAIVPTLPTANQAVVHFALPKKTLVDVGAATRSDKNELEKTITNIDLFVVEVTNEGEEAPADDAEVLAHYTGLTDNEGIPSININLSSKPRWIVAIVNATDKNIAASTFSDLNALSESTSALYSSLGTSYADQLPMYAMEYFNKIEEGITTLDLEHICSRIEVISLETDYVLETVTLLNGATTGHYIPRNPIETATVSPYPTTTIETTPYIYLFENNGGMEGSENYTDLILGGKYTISDGNIVDSYIKVKLEYGSPQTADIIRNTNFKLVLKEIKNNIGYNNLEDAQAGEYSDALIDIEIGTEALNDMIVGNGDYYMSFSNSEYRVFALPGTETDLTAFTLHFDKNSNSSIDITTVKKEISLGASSTGITLVDGSGDKTSTWAAGSDIDIKVDLEDDANGTIIVRIGNLIKEIAIYREQDATNLSTAFHDNNYVYAEFAGETPTWLKLGTKDGTPETVKNLHSTNGFTLSKGKDMWGTVSTELYLSRSSKEGRTKVFIEQYTHLSDPEFSYFILENKNIDATGQVVSDAFSTTSSKGSIVYLDGTTHEGDIHWRMEYSYDDGLTWTTEKPDWIDMPTSGYGSLDNSDIIIAPQPVTLYGKGGEEQELLRAASPLGSEATPYNLANSRGEADDQNTANCYLVNAPGTYKLPLIYGNAWKNGKDNPSSYTSGGVTGYLVLEQFLKHDDKPITKPQIEGATSAILCWQDAEDLISDVKISDNYLVFSVDKETIIEGNAIVAIRDAEDTILWSWHIWVTNYTDANDQDVYYNEEYTEAPNNYNSMMNVFLGWCNEVRRVYGKAPRSVKMRAKQSFGDNTQEPVTYTQKTTNEFLNYNAPYYQAGRKDPMISGTSAVYVKDHYGDLTFEVIQEKTTIGGCIQNPNILYSDYYHWADYVNPNSWSAKVTFGELYTDEHIKTVYDPTPVGYIVPQMAYFSGFTSTGKTSSNKNEFNVSDWDYGWNFYTELDKKGSTIHFPCLGYRLDETTSYVVNCYVANTIIAYNSSKPISISHIAIKMPDTYVFTNGIGLPMRPVKDKRHTN